jgi:hypothetical protein
MKKLYFLNEDEKHRILNLHKKRFNLNEDNVDYGTPNIKIPSSGIKIDRSSLEKLENNLVFSPNQKFTEIVQFKCKNNMYGGTPNEKIVQENLGYFKANFIGRSFWFTDDALKNISNKIKGLGTMANFCKLSEEFEKLAGKSLPMKLWNSGAYDSSFTKSFKAAIEFLEKNTSTSIETDTKTDTETRTFGIDQETGGETSGGGSYGGERKWRSMGRSYDNQILTALGKSGEKLTDDDIKDIYNKLKELGKIKE